MTGVAQSKVWGMAPAQVKLSACWSGYVDGSGNYDALPVSPNVFTDCTINRINPKTDPTSLSCPMPPTIGSGTTPAKADGDDKASDIAAAPGAVQYPTTVTVYTCMNWSPPMAGFVIIPRTITIRAVVTEVCSASNRGDPHESPSRSAIRTGPRHLRGRHASRCCRSRRW